MKSLPTPSRTPTRQSVRDGWARLTRKGDGKKRAFPVKNPPNVLNYRGVL